MIVEIREFLLLFTSKIASTKIATSNKLTPKPTVNHTVFSPTYLHRSADLFLFAFFIDRYSFSFTRNAVVLGMVFVMKTQEFCQIEDVKVQGISGHTNDANLGSFCFPCYFKMSPILTESERLTWNPVESPVCDVSRQLNVLHQAASCSTGYDIRDIAIHVYK
ncbi:hypothetical protein CSKR_112878 [Clonorchis sinensis]|uniref:Uncharacterized protein n=1 Tax=Clonorchis sinensis TaxID=79923 RepID=A0A419PMQ3_CLOSI|nr:hypothetical protein CSKR_112878 [Clonorchis sinensis]